MSASRSITFVLFLFISSLAAAKGSRGMFGLNAGVGIPFLSQAGANIYFSDDLGLDLDYNLLSITVGAAEANLAVPAALIKWHPFSGAFYIAAGAGQETLTSKATDALTAQTAEIKVSATTMIGKLGWMWGSSDGGLWFGVDVSYYSPSGAKTDITTSLPTTNQAYIDAKAEADKFGTIAYSNITFARIGYMF